MASGQARVALRSLSATPLGYGVLQYCKLTTLERKVGRRLTSGCLPSSFMHTTPWAQYMCQKATRPYKEYPVPSAVFLTGPPALPSFSSRVKIRWVVGI